MSMTIRILNINDADPLLLREHARLQAKIADADAQRLASWHAPWRRESLEHHLPLGWSFGVFDNQEICLGFYLAQPLLFFRGLTQTLWIEFLSFDESEHLAGLIDVAAKLAKEKHFQSVCIGGEINLVSQLETWKPQVINQKDILIKTTRF